MRFLDALLPVLELAVEKCRDLANEPEPAPVAVAATPKRKRAKDVDPEKPEALGEPITRMETAALRYEERATLRIIRDHGPLSIARLGKLYPMKRAARQRILQDLDRFGLVAGYWDARGWPIVHATEKAGPLLDLDPDQPWPRKRSA